MKTNKAEFIISSLQESSKVKLEILDKCSDDILKSLEIAVESIENGHKILFCGNGGSAADAQHLSTELVIRLSHDIKRPAIPALSLTTDTSLLTAGGNDIGFDNVFARSVEGLGNKGDVLIAISTSGNSENVLRAVNKAKEKGIKSIGFLGGNGGKLKNLVDVSIIIPSTNVQRIQEGHITIGHIICELIERELYEQN
ncbi:MAG: D-sedoheptulose 7-phosphate isomerase [Bacteroidetes bacterium]|jgi:D-sedoheptulose 7-phosphate isomerase|nr:D-sedoheptulose 7-phosphate isomerase [Bacteroidota bacterium]